MQKKYLGLFILVVLAFISNVYAEDEENIDVMDFPQQLATRLGLPLFPAQLLASLIFMSFWLFPTVFICSKYNRDSFLSSLFVGFCTLGICVGLGWFPVWTYFLLVIIIALLFAGRFTDLIGGVRGRT